MAQYYYFIASLPSLAFSAPPAVTMAWFLDEAARNLSPADAAELGALVAGRLDEAHTDFSRGWLNGDRQLRNAVARSRALRLGVDERKYLREHGAFRVDAEAAVDDAYSRPHPLERELALDRYRWSLAEELALNDPFGLPAVLSYAVRLRMLERWKPLTPELGRERLEEIVGVVGVSSQEVSGWSGLSQM